MRQRLQKILSEMGIASRRKAEEMILEGRVTVNGVIASIGTKADPFVDHIKVNGKLIAGPGLMPAKKVYYMFYKPRNVVTTLYDPEGRPTIKDYLKGIKYRVYPVGRLDFDSEGLLILTNDGDFANAMTHPSKKIPKTYHVKIKGIIEDGEIERLKKGIRLEDGMTMPAEVRRLRKGINNSWIEMTIYEGRKRQIRRMLEKVGHPVIRLIRVGVGPFKLRDMKPGEIREIKEEICCGIKDAGR
jgi:23S rRNA pseudouridine2605 synthase